MQFTLTLGDNQSGSRVTNNVRNETGHIQDAVDTGKQADGFQRQTHRDQHNVIITRPEPGMPAVPTDASTAVTITMICSVRVRSMHKT